MPPDTAVTPKHLLTAGTPLEIREALIPEDVEAFDEQYQAVLEAARTTLRLEPLYDFLGDWRRTASLQASMGPERYRAMLAMAEYIDAHGKPPPGTKTHTADESRAIVRQRLAELGVS